MRKLKYNLFCNKSKMWVDALNNIGSSEESNTKECIINIWNLNKKCKEIDSLKEKAIKQKQEDLVNAKVLSEEIKSEGHSKVIWEVLENWKINVTKWVIEKYINFGEAMWLSDLNPISIILKAIWENYLSEWELTSVDFLILWEYFENDISKWFYEWWKKILKQVEDNLHECKDDIKSFKTIYPRILGEMFWKKIWDKLKDQLSWFWENITQKDEDTIMQYYFKIDEKTN